MGHKRPRLMDVGSVFNRVDLGIATPQEVEFAAAVAAEHLRVDASWKRAWRRDIERDRQRLLPEFVD